jgi:spoIIIJ-associated protein
MIMNNDETTTLEIIAPSVDEAVEKGLSELGLTSDSVDVEVLDEGSKGLFGIGSRQARIRLRILNGAQPAEKLAVAAATVEPKKQQSVKAPKTEQVEAKPSPVAADANEDETLKVARATVTELLDKMKVKATVNTSYGNPVDDNTPAPVLVEIKGNDLSILIGRRSETLNALQYISSLIVGKELGHWVQLLIDVEGYRSRRERQLRQLARRMAEQAVTTGKRQVLEPMPANERRIIHLELRDNPDVVTESIGEEPNRKLTILPKK